MEEPKGGAMQAWRDFWVGMLCAILSITILVSFIVAVITMLQMKMT